jgi:phage-related baseplate assembly protein
MVSTATYTAVDLSKLPAPGVVETLDYETILGELVVMARGVMPDFSPLESDPVTKLLQVYAYRELILRQRINDAARAVMPAFAKGSDLDHLAANLGVFRLMLDPGNSEQGVAPTYESDEDFRRRFVLAPEGYSVAGPEGAYVFHAISAAADVVDASAVSPTPGSVTVHILTRTGEQASAALCATVEQYLSAETRRPLTDHVTVAPAVVVPYAIKATLSTFAGPDSAVVLAEAQKKIAAYTAASMRLGRDITLSGIYAALHVDGVQRVSLVEPKADIVCDRSQAPYCQSIAISYDGIGE